MNSEISRHARAILCMHAVAFLWGVAGVLGAMSSLDATVLVVGRALVALLTIFIWYRLKRVVDALRISRGELFALFLTGVLLGIHWIFFFRAISLGGVALALVTYSTGPAMIAVAEVCLGWAAFRMAVFAGAVFCCVGVWCIHPITSVAELANPGFVSGMISSAAIVLMSLSGKRLLRKNISALALTVGQLFGAVIVSLPFAITNVPDQLAAKDIFVIFSLGIFCSALGQTLFNRALVEVRISTASIIASMETPYGVVLAALLVSQPLTLASILGTCLVTASAIIVSLTKQGPRGTKETPLQVLTSA